MRRLRCPDQASAPAAMPPGTPTHEWGPHRSLRAPAERQRDNVRCGGETSVVRRALKGDRQGGRVGFPRPSERESCDGQRGQSPSATRPQEIVRLCGEEAKRSVAAEFRRCRTANRPEATSSPQPVCEYSLAIFHELLPRNRSIAPRPAPITLLHTGRSVKMLPPQGVRLRRLTRRSILRRFELDSLAGERNPCAFV
jgi:hypothetical protein